MNGKYLYALVTVSLVVCAAFGAPAWGGLATPSDAALSLAVGGACLNTNCGQTDACINQPGNWSKYYDYKLSGFYQAEPFNQSADPDALRDCIEVKVYINSNCNNFAGWNDDESHTLSCD